jgi:predicted ester cyclase
LHHPPFPDVEGLEAFKEFVTSVRAAYPDFKMTIQEVIVEEDTVASRWTWTGTHTGQGKLIPVPPTGKQVLGTGATFVRNEGGRIVEEWERQDWLGFLQQLGLAPLPRAGE